MGECFNAAASIVDMSKLANVSQTEGKGRIYVYVLLLRAIMP